MGPRHQTRWRAILHSQRGDQSLFQAFSRQWSQEAVPSVFSWVRTSPRKRKAPTERKNSTPCEVSARCNLNDSVESRTEQETEEVSSVTSESRTTTTSTGTQTDFFELSTEAVSLEKIQQLESEIAKLKSEIELKQRRLDDVRSRLFSFESMKSKDSAAAFYTGFKKWDVFLAIFNYLDPGEQGEKIHFVRSSSTYADECCDYPDEEEEIPTSKKGRARSLKPIDEFFLVMCRLRQGFHEDHLAHLFNISISTVSRIFISWINFMYFKFGQINIWPSREVVNLTMPEAFKKSTALPESSLTAQKSDVKCPAVCSWMVNYSATTKTIQLWRDWLEFRLVEPSLLSASYTLAVCHREIVKRSGFLGLPFDEHDSVMADKGFTIQDLLPLSVSLNLPPFLGSSSQMPDKDVLKTQEIASLRIHVERAINKIKNFHIWDRVIPMHQFGVINEMWAVTAFLCNTQTNIISI